MLSELADDPIVIVKLGAGGDNYGFIPPAIRKHTTMVTLDAANAASGTAGFNRWIQVTDVVADSFEPREFTQYRWWGCSSLLKPRASLKRRYGLESNFEEVSRKDVVPTTLAQILASRDISKCDALLTDLEGLDGHVLRASSALLDSTTLLQCELRFDPFFEGEMPMHEVVAFLYEKGFRLIGMKPEHWKPVSTRRSRYRDGVLAWADCTFFRPGPSMAKNAILLSLFGQRSLAAHLLEQDELLNRELSWLLSFRSPLMPRIMALARSIKWRVLGSPFPHVT